MQILSLSLFSDYLPFIIQFNNFVTIIEPINTNKNNENICNKKRKQKYHF